MTGHSMLDYHVRARTSVDIRPQLAIASAMAVLLLPGSASAQRPAAGVPPGQAQKLVAAAAPLTARVHGRARAPGRLKHVAAAPAFNGRPAAARRPSARTAARIATVGTATPVVVPQPQPSPAPSPKRQPARRSQARPVAHTAAVRTSAPTAAAQRDTRSPGPTPQPARRAAA